MKIFLHSLKQHEAQKLFRNGPAASDGQFRFGIVPISPDSSLHVHCDAFGPSQTATFFPILLQRFEQQLMQL